jgi:hypothetical protein
MIWHCTVKPRKVGAELLTALKVDSNVETQSASAKHRQERRNKLQIKMSEINKTKQTKDNN